MESRTIHEKTPNGGDYSEIYYMDDRNNIVDESVATKAVIRECTKDGKLISETWLNKVQSDGR